MASWLKKHVVEEVLHFRMDRKKRKERTVTYFSSC
jgi:hypothetical protein